jgi:hypothetical protein
MCCFQKSLNILQCLVRLRAVWGVAEMEEHTPTNAEMEEHTPTNAEMEEHTPTNAEMEEHTPMNTHQALHQ